MARLCASLSIQTTNSLSFSTFHQSALYQQHLPLNFPTTATVTTHPAINANLIPKPRHHLIQPRPSVSQLSLLPPMKGTNPFTTGLMFRMHRTQRTAGQMLWNIQHKTAPRNWSPLRATHNRIFIAIPPLSTNKATIWRRGSRGKRPSGVRVDILIPGV